MTMLKVDGVELPTPSGYMPSFEEISKADRNARGTMIKEVIAFKYKLEVSWKMLTQSELTKLMNVKRKNFFTLEFIDLDSGKPRTGIFYAGTPAASAMEYKEGKVDMWLDVKMNFIER
jgi:hypothetical protein